MAEKIIVAIILAIQIGSNAAATTSAGVGQDLQQLKENATITINKHLHELSKSYEEFAEISEKSLDFVTAYDLNNYDFEETIDKPTINIVELAENFLKKGKEDNRPDKYFLCVEEAELLTLKEVGTTLTKSNSIVTSKQKSTMENISYSIYCMEILFKDMQNACEQFAKRVKLCEDGNCIDSVVNQAKLTFINGDRLIDGQFKTSIKDYLKFKSIATNIVTKLLQEIAVSFKSGEKKIKMCQ